METYKKLTVSETSEGVFESQIESVGFQTLPEDYVLIKVHYSSLNYKDALSASGNKGISKNYPHTPGIDASGEITATNSSDFSIGQKVIVTGFDLGMNTSGGFAEYIQVPAAWVVLLHEGLSLKEAMIIGTAGLTAAMCIDKLLKNDITKGRILVSGASGGVGSMAILLLKHLGFSPIAISRKAHLGQYLLGLGANQILPNLPVSKKPLLKPLYDGGIDTLGGETLSEMLKQILPNGAVAACGMAQSPNFDITVFPFILRGVSLLGVDSAEASQNWRTELWLKLATTWKPTQLLSIAKTITLGEVSLELQKMLEGKQSGRVVVQIVR
jgi:acrylyl-CoA reductase (NADPH)